MGSNQSREQNIYKIRDKIDYSAFSPERRLEIKEDAMKSEKKYELKWVEREWALIEEDLKRQIHFKVENRSKNFKMVTCPNRSPFNEYEVGDYVYISPSATSSDDFTSNISNSDDMELVGKVDSEGKVRDSNGNLLEETGNFLNEITEANQRYAAEAESSRYQNQVLQFQTSYNLPPW